MLSYHIMIRCVNGMDEIYWPKSLIRCDNFRIQTYFKVPEYFLFGIPDGINDLSLLRKI